VQTKGNFDRSKNGLHFALLSSDGSEFDEQKIVTASGHPMSALCALPSSDSEQLGLIAIASSIDHIIRIYRLDETEPLYQLEGHTDTGSLLLVSLVLYLGLGTSVCRL